MNELLMQIKKADSKLKEWEGKIQHQNKKEDPNNSYRYSEYNLDLDNNK